jgi:hypothetical protein
MASRPAASLGYPSRTGPTAAFFQEGIPMRLRVALVLLVLPAASFAQGALPVPPHSASILLRLHPAPWRPPARPAAVAAGMRYEPEGGPPAPAQANATLAGARALAEANVRMGADGTTHAVLAGAIRSYSVVRLDESGRLVGDCVGSEAEAARFMRAATPPIPPKTAAKKEGD